MRRQQGGGRVMICGRIIGNAIIGPFRIPEGLKLSSATYCPFLKNSLEPWLDNLPLARLKKIIFMHRPMQQRQQRNFFTHLDL
jgi:hypothetical protein